MRLIFINRHYWPDESATSQMLSDLAEALSERGFEVTVIAGQAQPRLPSAEIRRGVRIVRIGPSLGNRADLLWRSLASLAFLAAAAVHLFVHVRRGDAVIALTDPPLLAPLMHPLIALRGGRLIHWWQDVYPEVAARLGVLRAGGWLHRGLRACRNASLRRADSVAISEGMTRHLRAAEPRTRAVTVIPNWSPDWTSDAKAVARWRREQGFDNCVLFIYSGNLGRAHEFTTLLNAAERLREHPGLRVLIIGDGAQIMTLRHEAERRQLRNWNFLPFQPRPQLALTLAAADVHIASLNPSMESLIFPSKIQGILSAGRPCLFIGDDLGEAATLLRSAQCGIAVRLGDVAGLEQQMRHLVGDAAERRRLGHNARRLYEQQFTPGHAVTAWEQLLMDAR